VQEADMASEVMTARKFRMRLKEAGVSQRRFAIWLGVDVGTVNRWARGRSQGEQPQGIPGPAALLANLLVDFPELRELAKTAKSA
jgi:DNA-binding transcriptional regulator YiaG